MDIKITSITEEIMRIALDQARDGRLHILGEMAKALDRRARGGQRERAAHHHASPSRRTRSARSSARAARSSARSPRPPAPRSTSRTTARSRSRRSTPTPRRRRSTGSAASSPSPSSASIYNGKVVKTVDFGAFVNFLGSRDGLVHISELAPQRVGKVADVVKVGDTVKVKVLGFDDRGKVKLSMRQVDQQTGEDLGASAPEPARAAAEAWP